VTDTDEGSSLAAVGGQAVRRCRGSAPGYPRRVSTATPINGNGNVPDGAEDPTVALEALRASIDNLDAAVIHLLAERFKCTQKVGALKARHGMPASDPAREARQIERLHRLARDADLDPVFAERFLAFVVDEVIRHHKAIAEEAATT